MKPQKNKIVFVLVLVGVVLFIVAYSVFTFGKDKKSELKPDRIPMPDLEENQKVYESKMEALDALKEEREVTAPQIYPDHMVDDKGYFNLDYMEYEKQRIIDSVYSHSKLVGKGNALLHMEREEKVPENRMVTSENKKVEGPEPVSIQERYLAHQLFLPPIPIGHRL